MIDLALLTHYSYARDHAAQNGLRHSSRIDTSKDNSRQLELHFALEGHGVALLSKAIVSDDVRHARLLLVLST